MNDGHGGAITLIQRSGSAADLDIHLHFLVRDGGYRGDANGRPTVVEAGEPTDEQAHALLQTLIARPMTILTRTDVLVEDTGQTWLAQDTMAR